MATQMFPDNGELDIEAFELSWPEAEERFGPLADLPMPRIDPALLFASEHRVCLHMARIARAHGRLDHAADYLHDAAMNRFQLMSVRAHA